MTSALLTLLFLPPLLMVGLSLPSYAIGLLIASGIIICSVIAKQEKIIISRSYLLVVALSGFWVFANPYSIANTIQVKQVLSLFAVLICGFAITSILKEKSKEFHNIIKNLFWVLLLVGSIGLLGFFKPGNYDLLNKPIAPFSEPSHFALVFVPIACAYVVTCSRRLRFFTCIASFLLAVLLPNLTLLIGALLISMIALSGRQITIFLVITFALGLAIFTVDPTHLEYFVNRVAESETENISRLVYIQGWESMSSALQFSNGLGVGYQNLGIEPPGETTVLLDTLMGASLNRLDGSFLAAKLVGEFGVIGIIGTLFMTTISIRSGLALRRHISGSEVTHKAVMVPLCFTYAIILELFVRGIGYFSPSLLIFLFFAPRAMNILGKIRKKAALNEPLQDAVAI